MSGPDPRIEEAKARPIGEIADRLGLALKPAGRERVGPCPACGGRDRFGINSDRNLFNCRSCGGGDTIRLVEIALGLGFLEALTWIAGERPARLDPAEEAARARARAAEEARRTAAATRERDRAIALARELWRMGEPPEGTPVRAYLERRGFARAFLPDLPVVLRYHPALRYAVREAGEWRVIHEGPAMLAAVTCGRGRLTGVHRTWIDPARPSGKAAIEHGGETLPAKKMLGSKKGGAIRLTRPREAASVLVMAEGIETTLSAAVADPIPGAAYWAGVDLGNMAGRRLPAENPGTGRSSTRFSEAPDLGDADAFVPPPHVQRLVYVQDGDSAARETRAKLIAGLARARALRPELRTQIVHAGEGLDLNDVLTGKDAAHG